MQQKQGGESLVNSNKLKGRIIEKGLTQAELAKKMGITAGTCCLKINNLRALSLDEANIISECLEIMPDEFGSYFFRMMLQIATQI